MHLCAVNTRSEQGNAPLSGILSILHWRYVYLQETQSDEFHDNVLLYMCVEPGSETAIKGTACSKAAEWLDSTITCT